MKNVPIDTTASIDKCKAIYNPRVAAALESDTDHFELRNWDPFDEWSGEPAAEPLGATV